MTALLKKNSIRWRVIFGAALVVYNVIVFAVPFPKNAAFFVSWLFTLAAIGAQVYVVRAAFYQGEGVKSKFYGWPIAKIGAVYLAVQLVLGLAFMALGFAVSVPAWLPLVLYAVLLGVSAVGFIAADAARDEVVRQDVKLKKDVTCIRSLQSKAMAILRQTEGGPAQEEAEKFAEALRFSDPVSSESLRELESELLCCVNEIQQAITDGDCAGAIALLKRANALLLERNCLCKLNKSERS